MIDTFNISTKVCCIVTDNAANIKSGVNGLRMPHIRFSAHTLNLIVKDAILKTVGDTLSKIRKVATYFKKNSTTHSKLDEMPKDMKLTPLKLAIPSTLVAIPSTHTKVCMAIW